MADGVRSRVHASLVGSSDPRSQQHRESNQMIPQDVWTTRLVGPRLRPRLQPVTCVRGRGARSGAPRWRGRRSSARSTSTGWPSPRGRSRAAARQPRGRRRPVPPAAPRSGARLVRVAPDARHPDSIHPLNVPTRQAVHRRPAWRRIRLDWQGTTSPSMTADSRSRSCTDCGSPGRRPRPVGPCGRTLPAADGDVAVTHGQARTGGTLIRVDSRREPRKDAADTLAWPRNQR